MTVSPDERNAYVTNISDNTGTASKTVVATVNRGRWPGAGIAILPPSVSSYVSNLSDNTVSVIATGGNAQMANVAVGTSPEGVAVAPDGKHVYVWRMLGPIASQ